MVDVPSRAAGRRLDNLLAAVGPISLGFRMQALAAHILLRLGLEVLAINQKGHPDIIAKDGASYVRVEVEADAKGAGIHLPLQADIASLTPRFPGDRGYFSLLVCAPFPHWLVVNSDRLEARRLHAPIPILEALSDPKESTMWTNQLHSILVTYGDRLHTFTFAKLSDWAIEGRSL